MDWVSYVVLYPGSADLSEEGLDGGVGGNIGFGWVLGIVGLVIAGIGMISVLAPYLQPWRGCQAKSWLSDRTACSTFPSSLRVFRGSATSGRPRHAMRSTR